MITKGASDIRGVHSINTRQGPITESSGHLKLYQLSAERDNLMKKLEWVKRQNDQTKRRLSEIAHGMHMMKRIVERKAKAEPVLNSNPGFRGASIKY
mgnify:FL=1